MQWEYLHLLVNLLSVTFALSLSGIVCQVALVAQILPSFRFVFTQYPIPARIVGAAWRALHHPARFQTRSFLDFVTFIAQILPFEQRAPTPSTSGGGCFTNVTLLLLFLQVVVGPTREAQVLVVAFRRPGLADIRSAFLPLGAVFRDARALNPSRWFFLLIRVVSRPVRRFQRRICRPNSERVWEFCSWYKTFTFTSGLRRVDDILVPT
jgi:hypothetical protein